MDDFIAALNEPFNDGELLFAGFIDKELPLLRNNRQIFGPPSFILRVVFIRLCLTQNMTKEPGHDPFPCFEIAVTAAHRPL